MNRYKPIVLIVNSPDGAAMKLDKNGEFVKYDEIRNLKAIHTAAVKSFSDWIINKYPATGYDTKQLANQYIQEVLE